MTFFIFIYVFLDVKSESGIGFFAVGPSFWDIPREKTNNIEKPMIITYNNVDPVETVVFGWGECIKIYGINAKSMVLLL